MMKKQHYKRILFYTITALCFIASIMFVNHNHTLYKRTIAEVTDTSVVDTEEKEDQFDNTDKVFTQDITAEIKNGDSKGQEIVLTNEYSLSGAYDQPYKEGNEVFVSIDKDADEHQLTGAITDFKRDKYLVFVLWVFIITLLLIGKRQGLFAALSLAVNIILLSYALDIYVNTGMNLLWICGITVVVFTVLS